MAKRSVALIALFLLSMAPGSLFGASRWFKQAKCQEYYAKVSDKYRIRFEARPYYRDWDIEQIEALVDVVAKSAISGKQTRGLEKDRATGFRAIENGFAYAKSAVPSASQILDQYSEDIRAAVERHNQKVDQLLQSPNRTSENAGITPPRLTPEIMAEQLSQGAVSRAFARLIAVRGEQPHPFTGSVLETFIGKEKTVDKWVMEDAAQIYEINAKLASYRETYYDTVKYRIRENPRLVLDPETRQKISENVQALVKMPSLHLETDVSRQAIEKAKTLLKDEEVPKATKGYLRAHLRFLKDTQLPATESLVDLLDRIEKLKPRN